MLKALKLLSLLLKNMVLLAVVGTTAISGYSIWHNEQVYVSAEKVRADLYEMKPSVSEQAGPNFEELRELNPDVVGWLTVDGTNIDYPVLQGETNMTYMNTDVYGQFSLAGSIFLDSRNQKEFKDRYSIIYGHHMENHGMFGDLDLFRDEAFFTANRSAVILTDAGEKTYQVLAYAELPDNVREVFDPSMWTNTLAGIETTIRTHSTHIWDSALTELINSPKGYDIVLLVTCGSGSTGERIVLFLTAPRTEGSGSTDPTDPPGPSGPTDPSDPSKPPVDPPIEPPPQTGDGIWNSPVFLIVMIVLFGCILCLLCAADCKRRRYKPRYLHKK